jgi:hypothetical protein
MRDYNSIRVGWETYRQTVMPADAGEVQVIECRRAFYAGAVHLFGAVVDNSTLPEADAMQRLMNFQDELAAFPKAISEGKA